MKRVIILIFLVFTLGIHCEEKKVFNINTFEVSPYSNEEGTGFDDLIVKEAEKLEKLNLNKE